MKVEELEKYMKVTADEGFFLTNFNEELDDIEIYSSCKIMFVPKFVDLTQYREITDEENDKYIEEKLNKIEKLN